MSWREAGEWWRRPASSNGRGSGADEAPAEGGPGDSEEDRGRAAGSDGAPREREYFRVLARPAGALSTGDLDADGFMARPGAVYDVYRDRVRREWRLARVWD